MHESYQHRPIGLRCLPQRNALPQSQPFALALINAQQFRVAHIARRAAHPMHKPPIGQHRTHKKRSCSNRPHNRQNFVKRNGFLRLSSHCRPGRHPMPLNNRLRLCDDRFVFHPARLRDALTYLRRLHFDQCRPGCDLNGCVGKAILYRNKQPNSKDHPQRTDHSCRIPPAQNGAQEQDRQQHH